MGTELRLGLWFFVLDSVSHDCSISSSSGDSAIGVTTPLAALGTVPAGGPCLSLPCGGPSEPLAVLFWTGVGGVAPGAGWPSSAGLFLLFVYH